MLSLESVIIRIQDNMSNANPKSEVGGLNNSSTFRYSLIEQLQKCTHFL